MEYNHRVGQCYDDKHVYHSTNASKYTLVFLKYVINEHVFMNLVSMTKYFQPQTILAR